MRLFLIAALCLCAAGQNTPGTTVPATEAKGLPPRATPDEYQTKGQAGAVTIAADFMGHSVPTPQGTYSTEDFVVVETALFGSPGARVTLSSGDFSLRINDKKMPLPSQPYDLVARSLKDPEWAPPAEEKSKSKTGISSGAKDTGEPPPSVIHMPIELQLAMQKRVKSAVLLGGDRALPQAGLIFFQYRGKPQTIHSVELIYTGPSGKATLTLQP